MFDEWAKNILAANGGNSGNIYASYNASKVNASPASATGRKAAVQANIDETQRQEAAAYEQKKSAIEQDKKDAATNPGKARMVMRADRSGYDYYDGAGNPMNINQFSLLTGKRPDEILADSDNPRDQKFVQDYKVMRDLSNAWVNGDKDTLAKYRASDPQKFNQLISQYKKPQDMVRGFMDYYTDYYGNTQGKNQNTPVFSPQNLTTPDKPTALRLGGATLDQTLTPTNTPKPQDFGPVGNLITSAANYGPTALVGRGTLWGPEVDARTRWEEERKRNPWAWYNSQLGR